MLKTFRFRWPDALQISSFNYHSRLKIPKSYKQLISTNGKLVAKWLENEETCQSQKTAHRQLTIKSKSKLATVICETQISANAAETWRVELENNRVTIGAIGCRITKVKGHWWIKEVNTQGEYVIVEAFAGHGAINWFRQTPKPRGRKTKVALNNI